jgi:hypothetical protein
MSPVSTPDVAAEAETGGELETGLSSAQAMPVRIMCNPSNIIRLKLLIFITRSPQSRFVVARGADLAVL